MDLSEKIKKKYGDYSRYIKPAVPLVIILMSATVMTPFLMTAQQSQEQSGIPVSRVVSACTSQTVKSVMCTSEHSSALSSECGSSEIVSLAIRISQPEPTAGETFTERSDETVSSEVIIDPVHSKDELKRTAKYFMDRKPELEASLKNGHFCSKTILLDGSSGIYAFVYARDENYSESLNGFFYYLIDSSASSKALSPVVLSVSTLFDESLRKEVTANGSYADPVIYEALRCSLKALLGSLYDEEVLRFIYQNYCRLFSTRLAGGNVPICFYKLELPGLDVYFRNAFMTYIEFCVK